MTMTLSGDGSITGLVAGGLPDATIQTADIVDGAVTAAKLSSGQTGDAPVFGCRAWCVFDGTRNVTNSGASTNGQPVLLKASGNVTSVTKNNTGDFTINFTTALPDGNGCLTGTVGGTGNGYSIHGASAATSTTTTVQVIVRNQVSNAPIDDSRLSVAVFR